MILIIVEDGEGDDKDENHYDLKDDYDYDDYYDDHDLLTRFLAEHSPFKKSTTWMTIQMTNFVPTKEVKKTKKHYEEGMEDKAGDLNKVWCTVQR